MYWTSARLGKLLKIAAILLLVGVSVTSWVQLGATPTKSASLLSCDGDSTETLILVQERHRIRVFFEVLKKMTSMLTPLMQNACANFEAFNSFELKSLFMNAYQRNVFYVYAFSTVP